MPELTCTICGGALETGFFLDKAVGGLFLKSRTYWIEGQCELTWMGNVKKLVKRRKDPVVALRCTNCGHLELFAPETQKPKTKPKRG